MKPIQFNDKVIDSFLFMELSDLAVTLTGHKELVVDYAFQSYYDPVQQKLTISHFWDNYPFVDRVGGMKSDVFLRAIGSADFTDYKAFKAYIEDVKRVKIPEFARQLFVLCEDLRIEEKCKQIRPGTKSAFTSRRKVYRNYFTSQQKVNLTKSVFTDALFNTVYLFLTAETLEEDTIIKEEINQVLPFLRSQMFKVYEATSTKQVANLCKEVIDVLDEVLEKDMLNKYFPPPELKYVETLNDNFKDLKRKDALKNDDQVDKNQEDEDLHDEEMPMWHRETSKASESFLQFDLEQGTKTELIGEGVRETEDGDQAMGLVQGSSKKANQNDFSQLEAMEKRQEENAGNGDLQYGKENRYATPIFLPPEPPEHQMVVTYLDKKQEILPYQKKLKQMIQKSLEHKKIMPRSDLHFGRLSKKLTRLVTEEQPRLFYKKQEPSPQIDAVFSLLVDCSASMFDKMDETKLGIILFHEALKSVLVPHQVVGFWEDASEATETNQPNYLKTVIDFQKSLNQKTGPEILQLEPEEDNRDGLAIRIITKNLLRRSEKQKFLLVFSDGEPAAMGYEQNGIIDTHEAVLHARKQGIEVINVFLSNGEIDENQQTTIRNIYGKYSILVSDISKLNDVLSPLLKKLLIKSL